MRLVAIIIGVIVIVMIAVFIDAWRLAKTVWLIVQVTPYEQTGVIGINGEAVPHIGVLGDSTGYGTGAGDSTKSIAGLIGADFPNYTLTNNSKNGRTIEGALATIRKLPTDTQYELMVLQIGGNDILQKRPLDQVRGELLQLYTEAKQRSQHVVMISSGNVGTAAAFTGTAKAAQYERITRQFRDVFIAVAAESGVTYVDLFQEPEADVFARDPDRFLAIDGLHPTAAGYAVWYETLGPVIKTILSVQRSPGQ